jgi:hypothetical protein
MIRTSTIDWIEGTYPDPCDNQQHLQTFAARATNTRAKDWFPMKGFNRYKMGTQHDSGVKVLSGRSDMGTHLIASGSALGAMRDAGITSDDLLALLLDQDCRPTRIDLAIDAVDSRMNFLRLFREIRKGRAVTKAKTPYLIQSGEDGWTLYVGAPQSDKHMRIYNKNAEVKHKAACPPGADDWIRIELVLMRGWARRAARLVGRSSVADAARSQVRSFIDFPTNNAWLAVVQGDIMDVGRSTRKITDTRKWLLDTVASVLARESLASPSLYLDFQARVQAEFQKLIDAPGARAVDDGG